MYHKVWEGAEDRLSIRPAHLEEHFRYLAGKGYRALGLPEFLAVAEGRQPYEPGTFLLTFDDGCLNHLTEAYPLIRKYGFRATFFIIGNVLDGSAEAEQGPDRKMNVEELRQLDPDTVQLALHSYGHIAFSAHSNEQIMADLEQNIRVFVQSGLPYHKVLAYPFGARPRAAADKQALKQQMISAGIRAAFRIGNQPCAMPAADLMELKRIDIWGTDTVQQLAIKYRKGKRNLF